MEYYENDNEIIFMIGEINDEATSYLIDKYKSVVEYYVNKYKDSAINLGIETDDLFQEGLVGILYAINKYKEFKDVKFSTYVSNIIKYNILKLIDSELRGKKRTLNEALSLDYIYSSNSSLEEFIGEDNTIDILIQKEMVEDINNIIDRLGIIERKIFIYKINGYTIDNISKILSIEKKKVSNSIYKIKRIIKNHLNKYYK